MRTDSLARVSSDRATLAIKCARTTASHSRYSNVGFQTGLVRIEWRSDELGSESIRSKQAAEAFGCFAVGFEVVRSVDLHDQFVVQTMAISRCMRKNKQGSDGFVGRVIAQSNPFVRAFGFQGSEETVPDLRSSSVVAAATVMDSSLRCVGSLDRIV